MKRPNKLAAVTRHESLTIIRQPSFWITLLIAPVFFAIIIAVGHFSAQGETDVEERAKEYRISVVDESGFINEDVSNAFGVKLTEPTQLETQKMKVRDAELDGLLVYPDNLAKSKTYTVIINSDDEDQKKQSVIVGLGEILLNQSLVAPIESPAAAELLLSETNQKTITFRDGMETTGITAYIVPGAFVVLFFLAMVMTVGYALTSVSEEKENRAIEMSLSYVQPRTLMSGKLLGTTLVTLVQFTFYLIVAVAAFFTVRALGDGIELPFRFDELAFEWRPIMFGAFYFITGFLFYVALMLAVGAAFPSAKESGGFTTVVYLLAFSPFWALEAVLNNTTFLTQFMTFFPFSAPITLLLRNAAGNLELWEALIGAIILVISTVLAIWLAGKLFRLGALNFSSRVKISELFK